MSVRKYSPDRAARISVLAIAVSSLSVSTPAMAEEPERRQALFGDLHVHTSLSFDAYTVGTRATPDDAYRYARGEKIRHASGFDIQLQGGPLDFYAVADHAEYLGVVREMGNPASPVSTLEISRNILSTVRDNFIKAFYRMLGSIAEQKPIEELVRPEMVKTGWQEVMASADRYYDPGHFTTFAAYEYTSQPDAQNLHRVVVFRGSRRPEKPFSAFDSSNPEDLWAWMDQNRDMGIDGIAIPHNSNLSNGRMFELSDYVGNPMDAGYAETRLRNEPVVEITQIKGTSETSPELSPEDEFAGFEQYRKLLGRNDFSKPDGSYVRQALQRGLLIEERTGKNPYKFGIIGSSDTHNGGSAFEEKNYFGKTGNNDGTPKARGALNWPTAQGDKEDNPSLFSQWGASGLVGVWAEQNNREEIFAALRRKETFATSGPRIKVRLFAGYGYPNDITTRTDAFKVAYDLGVPMGSDLEAVAGSGSPTFFAMAMKDARGAGLQRLQIVRGWVENGKLREKIYDIACAKGVPNTKSGRCADQADAMDAKRCEVDPGKGSPKFLTTWRDPDYSANRRAFYYLRAIEEPTCRWSTFESNSLNLPVRKPLPLTIQERAWSSPIWVG